MRNVLLERLLLQAVQRCLSPAAPGELGLRREERESVQMGGGAHGEEERVCTLGFCHRPVLRVVWHDWAEGMGNSHLCALVEADCTACGQGSGAQGQVCDTCGAQWAEGGAAASVLQDSIPRGRWNLV